MLFTSYNHPVTDQCIATYSEWQTAIIHNRTDTPKNVSWADYGPLQVPKAEVGSKIPSFVNQYQSILELVDQASNT